MGRKRLRTFGAIRGACALALAVAWLALASGPSGAAAVKLEPDPRAGRLEARLEMLRAAASLARPAKASAKRVALVVGNDAYDQLDPLKKAVADSSSIAEALGSLGFDVTRVADVDVDAFDDALTNFYGSIGKGDVAFFFYAGHGVASDGQNWLLPVDMPEIEPGEDPRLERRAVNAADIAASIRSRGAELAFVVLDACRDDPFPQAETRSVVRMGGLARMTADQGQFIIYSAGAGEKALDRLDDSDESPNSVFTRKFMPILATPGLPIAEIAKRTQVEVKALADTVSHRQAPAYYDQVIGQFYFQAPRPRLWGITIGVDEYNRERRLAGAVNDARRIASALRGAGADEVIEILDRDARPAFIDFAWRSIVERARPGDTLVFAYAGASSQTPAPVASKEADGSDEYLALADADWDGLMAKRHPGPGAVILDDQLTQWMELAAARNLNVILLVDGCYGGGLLDREFANISFIGSSAENELVYEFKIGGEQHGAMSVAFAEAIEGRGDLNGDGFVSQAELFAYAEAATYDMAGRTQTPQFFPAMDVTERSLALFSTREQDTPREADEAPDAAEPSPAR